MGRAAFQVLDDSILVLVLFLCPLPTIARDLCDGKH